MERGIVALPHPTRCTYRMNLPASIEHGRELSAKFRAAASLTSNDVVWAGTAEGSAFWQRVGTALERMAVLMDHKVLQLEVHQRDANAIAGDPEEPVPEPNARFDAAWIEQQMARVRPAAPRRNVRIPAAAPLRWGRS